VSSVNGAAPELAVSVRGLRVDRRDGHDIVDEISFDVPEGEVLALVGESGCGKTATALACMGFARTGSRIAAGSVCIGGVEMLDLDPKTLRRQRGSLVSYVPQDPSTALNPSYRVGKQVAEMFGVHRPDERDPKRRVAELFASVGLPSEPRFLRRYPHELSGGQQQRVAIAMAIALRPRLILLDEPTTGLDVTTQARVLQLIDRLRREERLSMLYVTHDLAVVAQIADRVAVMYSGRLVETAERGELFATPRHPYTRRLLAAIPRTLARRERLVGIPGSAAAPGERPSGCFFRTRCTLAVEDCVTAFPPVERPGAHSEVRCYRWREVAGPPTVLEPVAVSGESRRAALLEVEGLVATYPDHALGGRGIEVLHGVSFRVESNETLAVVGESGSGKSTLGRCILGLHAPASGRLEFDGQALAPRAGQRPRELRQQIQIVFQNPDSSLNPRQTVGRILERPLEVFFDMSRTERRQRVIELLDMVRLPAALAPQYPGDLSGGEKQRVALASALAAQPRLLVCDEITSALDVSVQAAALDLLADLQHGLETAFVFISHDLAVVRSVADRILVVEDGSIREEGQVDDVFGRPEAGYTRALLDAVPSIDQSTPARAS
jgi:peptide/nickel transport system ATP-binding protein